FLSQARLDAAPAADRDRILFYIACSNAALALLEGAGGKARLTRAQEQYRQLRTKDELFTVDRRYISPQILNSLHGCACAPGVAARVPLHSPARGADRFPLPVRLGISESRYWAHVGSGPEESSDGHQPRRSVAASSRRHMLCDGRDRGHRLRQ